MKSIIRFMKSENKFGLRERAALDHTGTKYASQGLAYAHWQP